MNSVMDFYVEERIYPTRDKEVAIGLKETKIKNTKLNIHKTTQKDFMYMINGQKMSPCQNGKSSNSLKIDQKNGKNQSEKTSALVRFFYQLSLSVAILDYPTVTVISCIGCCYYIC